MAFQQISSSFGTVTALVSMMGQTYTATSYVWPVGMAPQELLWEKISGGNPEYHVYARNRARQNSWGDKELAREMGFALKWGIHPTPWLFLAYWWLRKAELLVDRYRTAWWLTVMALLFLNLIWWSVALVSFPCVALAGSWLAKRAYLKRYGKSV